MHNLVVENITYLIVEKINNNTKHEQTITLTTGILHIAFKV